MFRELFYARYRRGRAAHMDDGVIPRLRKKNITLFTPWGPRYQFQNRGTAVTWNDRETATLRYLGKMFARLRDCFSASSFRWLFLGADLYGTCINNLPLDAVAEYFAGLRSMVTRIIPFSEFRLWSEFDADAGPYRTQYSECFSDVMHTDRYARAKQTAKRLGRGGDAKAYLVERLAEAALIEDLFKPMMISCVERHKDDEVDLALPRLYLIPKALRSPWM